MSSRMHLARTHAITHAPRAHTCHHACPSRAHRYARLTDAGLRELGAGCRELSVVILSACVLVTDGGVRGLIESCEGLQRPSRRERGNSEATQRLVLWQPIPGVTREGVLAIKENYPHLEIDSF